MHITNIILDLDNTLICSMSEDELRRLPPAKHRAIFSRLRYHRDDGLFIFERPGLGQFLNFIFANFERVSVWTAASKEYALIVVDSIFGSRPLDYLLFWHHCTQSICRTGNLKDISLLCKSFKMRGYDLSSTVIIDDNDEVLKCQPAQSLRAPPFDIAKMPHPELDDYLLSVAVPALKLSSRR